MERWRVPISRRWRNSSSRWFPILLLLLLFHFLTGTRLDCVRQATSKRPLAPHFHELRRVKSQDLKWNVFDDHCVLLRTTSVTLLQSSWQNHDLLLSVYNDSLQEMAENKAPFAQPAVVTFTTIVPAPLLPVLGIKTAGPFRYFCCCCFSCIYGVWQSTAVFLIFISF